MNFLKNIAKNWYFGLFLIAIFPILNLKSTSISIIFLSALGVTNILLNWKHTFKESNLKWLGLFLSLYLIYLISAFFYPLNRASGFVLEKKMSLFIFPIILFLTTNKIPKKHLKHILLTFSFTTILVLISTNIIILITGIPLKYSLIADFNFSYRTYFTDISNIHPTYISIYLAFSALIFIHYSLKTNKFRPLFIALSIICFIGMIPLSAKLPLLAFIIAISTYFLIQPKIWKRIKYYFFAFIAFSFIAIFTIPSLTLRIQEISTSAFSPPKGGGYNSINVRSGIWDCSTELIKEHWLKGVGAGKLQGNLNSCYQKFDTNAYDTIDYNTHNEYFNILLSTGILGLLIFTVLLLTLSYFAFKEQKHLFFSFMILLILCFTTENILDRQGGSVFFIFFTTLFTKFYFLQKQETLVEKE